MFTRVENNEISLGLWNLEKAFWTRTQTCDNTDMTQWLGRIISDHQITDVVRISLGVPSLGCRRPEMRELQVRGSESLHQEIFVRLIVHKQRHSSLEVHPSSVVSGSILSLLVVYRV